jgi:hypothetical protein
LLSNGADPNIADCAGRNALFEAVDDNNVTLNNLLQNIHLFSLRFHNFLLQISLM